MTDITEKLVDGEFFVLAEVTEDAEGTGFSFFMLGVDDDPQDYITVMTSEDEVQKFVEMVDVPEEFTVEAMDAGFLLDLVDDEMHYLVNPATDGLVFDGPNFRDMLEGIAGEAAEE